MATWQFDCHLLPLQAVQQRFGAIPVAISRQQFDEVPWWDGVTAVDDLVAELLDALPRGSSWTPSISTCGAPDGDRIDVVRSESTLDDVLVRFDLRTVSVSFVNKIVQVARTHRLVLLTEDNHVLRPSASELLAAFRRSASFRFVEDPIQFLEKLGRSET